MTRHNIRIYPQPCVIGMSPSISCLHTDKFSTLMKLHKNYLGDAFSQRPTSSTDFHISHRIRERSEQSYNALVETSSRIVEFAISLERRIATSGVDQVSPLVLHCIYRAAFWMSYLLDSTGDETFAAGRLTCHQVLKVLEPRWALAGSIPTFDDEIGGLLMFIVPRHLLTHTGYC